MWSVATAFYFLSFAVFLAIPAFLWWSSFVNSLFNPPPKATPFYKGTRVLSSIEPPPKAPGFYYMHPDGIRRNWRPRNRPIRESTEEVGSSEIRDSSEEFGN